MGMPRRTAWRAALPLLLALAAATLAVPGALAHAELESSEPAQGTHLVEVPARVSVTLTEPVDPVGTRLHVLDKEGTARDLGDMNVANGPHPTISVGLPPDLPDGAYRIVWQALSSTDGHPTGSTIGFAIGGFTPPEATASNPIPVNTAFARFLSYAGLSLAFGAAAFLMWMAPAGYPRAVARIALAAGATLNLAGTLLLTADTASRTGIALADLGTSEVGLVHLSRLALSAAAWLLAVVWTFRPVGAGPAVVTTLLLGAALYSARLGHPYAQGPAVMALDFAHLVSAGTWVGGLALLLYLVWQAERRALALDDLRRMGVRFGTLALVCVATLAISGLVIAVAVVGLDGLVHPQRLLATPYGMFLAGKVGLALLMVVLAGINRYVLLEGPAEKGIAKGLQKVAHKATGGLLAPGLAAGKFGRTLAIEASLGVVVLVLAGLLTSVSPPAAALPPPYAVDGQGEHFLVHAEMAQPHVGNQSVMHITVTSADDGTVLANNTCGRAGSCVGLDLLYPGANATEHHEANPSGGLWMVHDVIWAQAGNVTATVTVSTADVYSESIALHIVVLP